MSKGQIDSFDLRILNRVNELADRFGVSPLEFRAAMNHPLDTNPVISLSSSLHRSELAFYELDSGKRITQPKPGTPLAGMFSALGVHEGALGLFGRTDIYNAIEQAFDKAPPEKLADRHARK